MKYKILFVFLLVLGACGETKKNVTTEPENPSKYKKGDIVCVVTFNVKGIIQYETWVGSDDDKVYSVMFVDKYDQLYNLNIYESQLTVCL